MDSQIQESILQMAEAHLLNVQREVQKLEAKRLGVDEEIERLKGYLTESVESVNIARMESQEEPLNTPAAF